MKMPPPSAERRAGSRASLVRCSVTPGTRWSASETERSGSAPMSCAVIESTICSAFFLRSRALRSEARMPVTMIAFLLVVASGAVGDSPAG